MENSLIEQVCVTGTNLKQPISLLVLTPEAAQTPAAELKRSLEKTLRQVNERLESHERLDSLVVVNESWSAENGLLTPTLKIKRSEIEAKYAADRKSTRLNSSHVRISYAVFCLKKKKKKQK